MLSEKEQQHLLLPFRKLAEGFAAEIKSAKSRTEPDQVHSNVEKLEQAKTEIEACIQLLVPRLQSEDAPFEEVAKKLEADRMDFTLRFYELSKPDSVLHP